MPDDRRPLVPSADDEMDELKQDVAEDLDIPLKEHGYNGNLTAHQLGKIGGTMVKRLVKRGEQDLADDDDEPES